MFFTLSPCGVLAGYVDELLVLCKPLFVEEGAQGCNFSHPAVALELFVQVASFQAEQSVGQGILLCLLEVLLNDFHQVGQLHDCTAYHEVIFPLFFFSSQVFSLEVFQSDGLSHLVAYSNLLARTVDEFESALREEDGKRNTREASSASEIEDLGSVFEVDGFGDSHGVQHVVFVEIIYVLSADDIDLGVPLSVQSVKLRYLLFLSVREVRKVFVDDIHVVFCYCGGKVTKKR